MNGLPYSLIYKHHQEILNQNNATKLETLIQFKIFECMSDSDGNTGN